MLAAQMSLGNDRNSGHALKRKHAPASRQNTSASGGKYKSWPLKTQKPSNSFQLPGSYVISFCLAACCV